MKQLELSKLVFECSSSLLVPRKEHMKNENRISEFQKKEKVFNYPSRSYQTSLFSVSNHTVPNPDNKRRKGKNLSSLDSQRGKITASHLSFTLQHGSIISSLAATLATQPFTIVFK